MLPDNDRLSNRTTLILFAVLIILLIGAVVIVLAARPDPVMITINPPLPTATGLPEPTVAPITVYVSGAVAQPAAVYTLPAGSRVMDALDAAGGVADEADLSRVNLAALLRDGDQVHVPLEGESARIDVLPTVSGGVLIAINSATLEALQTLPGVGPALAERIITYRETVGRIESPEDLDEVSGIGPALLEQIVPLITFD
jgi:competence protein ComEA